MSIDDEIIADFIIESDENLETLEQCLIEIEKGGDPDVDALFRAMHSVKSAAAFLEIETLEKLAHSAETSLSFVRDFGRPLSSVDVDVLIRTTGIAQDILEAFKDGENFESSRADALFVDLEAMEKRMETGDAPSESQSEDEDAVEEVVVDTPFEPEILNRRSLRAAEPVLASPSPEAPTPLPKSPEPEKLVAAEGPKIAKRPVRQVRATPIAIEAPISNSTAPTTSAEKEEVAPPTKQPTVEPVKKQKAEKTPVLSPKKVEKKGGDHHNLADSKVNVSTALLDEIINLIGELVVARNQIVRHVEEEGLDTIKSMILPIAHLTTDIQERVMKTRMRQIGSAWGRYPRMVRDLAREISKEVNLVMVGQETELDRSLLTMLQEPMRHMLRNSVDHGLETPEERVALGKPATGTVWLKAYQASGQVVIEIADDGRGLDSEKIKQKAIAKGLITPQKADLMTEEDLRKLIFAPGFSTKEAVTNISGRGVGMDVVQTLVSKVNGMIEIDSILGQGSTFRIRLPLTLAILPALIVLSNDHYFAIPQDNLLEIIDIQDGQDKISELAGTPVYHLRGNLLPLVTLKELTTGEAPEELKGFILVVNVSNNKFGLIVEDLRDTEEIVVKPLGLELQSLKIFSGVTIHGNGKIAWIVDAASVAQMADFDFIRSGREQEDEIEGDKRSLLRFENSTIGSIAVDILSVLRVEQISFSDITRHGERYVYSFNGRVIPVFTFGLTEERVQKCSLVIVEYPEGKIALLAEKVHDVCHQTVELSSFGEDWAEGLALLSDIPTSIIDINRLVEKLL